jgi:hypothetical protein
MLAALGESSNYLHGVSVDFIHHSSITLEACKYYLLAAVAGEEALHRELNGSKTPAKIPGGSIFIARSEDGQAELTPCPSFDPKFYLEMRTCRHQRQVVGAENAIRTHGSGGNCFDSVLK